MSDSVQVALIMVGGMIITAIPPFIMALKAKRQSAKNEQGIKEVHQLINSGLTVRLADTKEQGNLEGRRDQRAEDKIESKKGPL